MGDTGCLDGWAGGRVPRTPAACPAEPLSGRFDFIPIRRRQTAALRGTARHRPPPLPLLPAGARWPRASGPGPSAVATNLNGHSRRMFDFCGGSSFQVLGHGCGQQSHYTARYIFGPGLFNVPHWQC